MLFQSFQIDGFVAFSTIQTDAIHRQAVENCQESSRIDKIIEERIKTTRENNKHPRASLRDWTECYIVFKLLCSSRECSDSASVRSA